jgi:hypothetical protein
MDAVHVRDVLMQTAQRAGVDLNTEDVARSHMLGYPLEVASAVTTDFQNALARMRGQHVVPEALPPGIGTKIPLGVRIAERSSPELLESSCL